MSVYQQEVIAMNKSTVYFTYFHVTPREPLPQTLNRLMKSAGF